MYLEPEAIHQTFLAMTEYMGPHSRIAFDYVYLDVLQGEGRHYGESEVVKSVSGVNEVWRFGIEQNHLESFLAKYGWRVVHHMNAKEMEEAYFKDERGRIIGQVNDTHCLVTAEKWQVASQ